MSLLTPLVDGGLTETQPHSIIIVNLVNKGNNALWQNNTYVLALKGRIHTNSETSTVLSCKLSHLIGLVGFFLGLSGGSHSLRGVLHLQLVNLTCIKIINVHMDVVEADVTGGPVGYIRPITVTAD